jgi:hypothetical protein
MDINIKGDIYMQNTTTQNSKLPFKCRMVCVSLVGGSLILTLIIFFYYMGYISPEAALWAAASVFVMAAIYESFLLFLLTRHMLNRVNENSEES